jgi:hypothetical protein
MVAALMFGLGIAPALADQSDPPNEAPNVRAAFSRDTRTGYQQDGAQDLVEHVHSFSHGTSSYAPESTKANEKAHSNPSRD